MLLCCKSSGNSGPCWAARSTLTAQEDTWRHAVLSSAWPRCSPFAFMDFSINNTCDISAALPMWVASSCSSCWGEQDMQKTSCYKVCFLRKGHLKNPSFLFLLWHNESGATLFQPITEITEWPGLEGSSRIMKLQSHVHRQGHQPPHLILDQAAEIIKSNWQTHPRHAHSSDHSIIELLMLERASKIIKSNHRPITTLANKRWP